MLVAPRPALLLAHHLSLAPGGGGVQVCNREYFATLERAGYALEIIPFEFHDSLAQKVRRRLAPRVFVRRTPEGLAEAVEASLTRTGAKTVFHMLAAFPDLSRDLRKRHPDVKQVLLSHGVESLDFCIEQRVRAHLGRANRSRAQAERMLGGEFLDEVDQRQFVDSVITLSPFEAEVEQWLGAPKVMWAPRTITEPPLDLTPVDGRVGSVGTLNHPPNLDSLTRLLEALEPIAKPPFRFRLVGSPTSEGERFARRYSFVDYAGRLSDEDLREEARTWCCFVHPMFLFAKGASTKLATPLGWGLPLATTRYGVRGYVWDESKLPLAESPQALAELTLRFSKAAAVTAHRKMTADITAITPTLDEVGRQIATFLDA